MKWRLNFQDGEELDLLVGRVEVSLNTFTLLAEDAMWGEEEGGGCTVDDFRTRVQLIDLLSEIETLKTWLMLKQNHAVGLLQPDFVERVEHLLAQIRCNKKHKHDDTCGMIQ